MTISRNLSILAEGVSSSGVLAVTNGGTGVTTSTGTGSTVLSASPTLTGTLTVPTVTSPSATALTIQSAGTTAMTVDTSQNVGIGTTSPGAKLDVNGASVLRGTVNITSGNNLDLYNSDNTNQFTINNIGATGSTNAGLSFVSSGVAERMRINSSGNVGIGYTTPGQKLVVNGNTQILGGSYLSLFESTNNNQWQFQNNTNNLTFTYNSSEAMRIDSSGNLLVGTTAVNGKITSKTTSTSLPSFYANTPSSFAAAAYQSDSITAASTSWYHFYGTSSSATVANVIIYGNGNIQNANNSYGAISDVSLKENINDATPKLDDLLKVQVRNYNLKNDPEKTKQIGVVAQELELIFPAMVEENNDGIKGVKYSVFVPMLIKCIQELSAKNDSLMARVAALEGK